MGLFGRDDRSSDTKPQSAPTAARSTPAAAPRSGITVVAAACRIEGLLSGSGDVLIEGQVSGEIAGTAAVTVAEGGSVEATVHGQTVIVSGRVRGDISASDKIELTPSADVAGNITSPRILIREGATFEGQVFMKKPDAKKQRAAEPAADAGGDAKHAPAPEASHTEARNPQGQKGGPGGARKS